LTIILMDESEETVTN